MKDFRVDAIAQAEFEQAAFVTAAIATVTGGFVRREFVERFPYVVVFVETGDLRKVIMIRRGSSSPARWQARI